MNHAFIADGRLYLRLENGKLEEIESSFARAHLEDFERRKTKREWKSASQESPFASFSLWGSQSDAQGFSVFRFISAIPRGEKELCYLLANRHVTGLFLYNVETREERRLFHKNHFHCFGIDFSAQRQLFVASLMEEDGASNLNLLSAEGKITHALTAGDSRDSHPFFSREKDGLVYYQSAGIARNEEGTPLAFGPEGINRVDLESGEVEEIVADGIHDYLLPKDDRAGNLYCIRRRHRATGSPHPLLFIWNTLLFPFHFLVAVVGFLQTFTHLFGEKKEPGILGPPRAPSEKQKYIQLFGETIHLAKLKSTRNEDNEAEFSLVSKEYELLKITPEGDVHTLARKVACYDVSPDGEIHISNGFGVRALLETGPRKLFSHRIIESLRMH